MRTAVLLFALLAAPLLSALAKEPEPWTRVRVPRSPVSCEVPRGWTPHHPGDTPVGYAESSDNWNLQVSRPWRRLIFYLTKNLDSITVRYHSNDRHEGYRSMDDYIDSPTGMGDGRVWGEDKKGTWRGFRTLMGGRKHKPYRPGGSTGIRLFYLVEFGRREFLTLELSCDGSNFEEFLPYFLRVKDSLSVRQ